MKTSLRRLLPYVLVLGAVPAANAEGVADSSFGGGGSVTLTPASGYLYESLATPDGKVLVSTTHGFGFKPTVVRLLEDGTPDPTFGNLGPSAPGRTEIDMTPFDIGFASTQKAGFAVSADGSRIYLSGYGPTMIGATHGAIVRVDANGQLDTSFGAGGAAVLPQRAPYYLQTEPDGRIAGLADDKSSPLSQTRFVFRVLANGNPDVSFGDGGFVTIAQPSGTDTLTFRQLLRAPDGSYYVVGDRHSDSATVSQAVILRFLANGARDLSFAGGSGMAVIDFDLDQQRRTFAGRIALLADGKLLLSASARRQAPNDYRCAVARLTPDGVLDPTFGTGGMRSYGVPDPWSPSSAVATCDQVIVRRDGRFIVVGRSIYHPFSMALNADGSVHTAYGTDGVTYVGGYGMLDRYERLVVAAPLQDGAFEAYVARLTADDVVFANGFEP